MVRSIIPVLLCLILLSCTGATFEQGSPGMARGVSDGSPMGTGSPAATWDYVMDPNATFAWYDARSGTNLTLQLKNNQGGNDRDDGFASAPFKNFNFNFYGIDYSTIYVGSNGYTGFHPNSDYTVSVPGVSFPTSDSRFQKILAPYWDDLDFTSRGAIYFKELPDDQNPQAVVIEFFKAAHFGNADEVWCELVLMQDGTILFQYKYVKYVQSGIITGSNDGDGKHYNIYNELNATTVDRAIAFYRPATITVTGTDIAQGQVPQGATDVNMLRLNIKPDRGTVTIFGIKMDLIGSLPGNAIDDVRLYQDVDHSGNLSTGDKLLGLKQFVSGSLTFPLSFRVGVSGDDLVTVLNLSPSAKAGRTFGLLLSDKSYVITNQFVSETTFPIQTKLVLVLDSLPDTLYITGMNQAPLTVERGRVNVVMLALVLQVSSDYVTLASINITRTGNATDADVSKAVLIYDKDRSGGYSGGDVPIAYAKVISGTANFTFAFQMENPDQEILLIGYNISAYAVMGRTVGALLPSDPDKVTVLSPDLVAPHPSLFSYNSTIVGDVTPPEVQAVQIQPPSPVKEGNVTFTVTFTEEMNGSVQPTVSFGLTPPFDQHQISGNWVTPADWQGTYQVVSGTGDGNNTISIRNGVDIQGNAMVDDTFHSFVIDTRSPESNASPLPSQTYVSSFPIKYISSDAGTGVRSVELLFRYEMGAWSSYGNFTGSPVTFNSSGDGTYDFYTIAVDMAGNVEEPPSVPDASTLVDSIPPSSHVTVLDLYYNTTEFNVPFEVQDDGTGIEFVQLFYRVSGGTWNIYPIKQSVSPFKFNASINGIYDFYTIGVDKVGHREHPPPVADASTAVDIKPPTVKVAYPNGNEILVGGTRVNMTWEAFDDLGISGATKVLLSLNGGGTWSPIGSTSGDMLSWDIPGNIDSQQCLVRVEVRDLAMNLGTDRSDSYFTIASTIPASTALPLPKYMNKSSFDVQYTAFDPKGQKIESVVLFARMGNGDWFEAGQDSTNRGKVRFTSNGDSDYEFYTVAHGSAARVEPSPTVPDTSTIIDTIAPTIKEVVPKGEFTGTRANVTVFFSESMDTGTVSFEEVPIVNGTLEWSNDNATLSWKPRDNTPGRMIFTVYGRAKDIAGNEMGKDYVWEIAPPGPPDAWPVFVIVLLSAILTTLLGLFVIRKRSIRCVKCGIRIHSGKYCVKCTPKPEGTDGEIVDGVFIGRPTPLSPEDEGKFASGIIATRSGKGTEVKVKSEPEQDVEPSPETEGEPQGPRSPLKAEDGAVIGELKKVPTEPGADNRELSARERLQRIREKRRGGR